MRANERARLVLAFARVLYVSGQTTEQTVDAADGRGRALGLDAKLLPRWGTLHLLRADGARIGQVEADPASVNMHRVASAMWPMDEFGSGRLAPNAAMTALREIAYMPPAPTSIFALAAAAGAAAMAVIFGLQHVAPAVAIFLSAGAGALLRRALIRVGENFLLQPFCAALVAGFIACIGGPR